MTVGISVLLPYKFLIHPWEMDKLHKIIFSERDCNLPDLRPGSDAEHFISRTSLN